MIPSGKLILILGCMWSGKSTKLLQLYYKYRLKYNCLLINHKIDSRYKKDNISTHDLIHEKSLSLNKILSLSNNYNFKYKNAKVILIDEAQFFNHDIIGFTKKAVNLDNKIVVISALNGDFNKKKIGFALDLVPEADEIFFQKAICHYCSDPTEAIFSKKISIQKRETQIDIGGLDKYVSVCRYHFNN